MKTTTSSNLLLALLATLLLVLLIPMVATQVTPETQDRIDNICRSNEDYGFCNKVFQNDILQPEVDYVGLTSIATVEAQKNASNTLYFIRAQIRVENDPEYLNHLIACEKAFVYLKQSFDKALVAFNKKDYKEVHSIERDTPRVQANCVTIFSAYSVPLNERNREMRILITMAVVSLSNIIDNN